MDWGEVAVIKKAIDDLGIAEVALQKTVPLFMEILDVDKEYVRLVALSAAGIGIAHESLADGERRFILCFIANRFQWELLDQIQIAVLGTAVLFADRVHGC